MKRFFGIILSVIMIMSIFTLPLSVVSSASTPGIVLSEDDITLEVGEACVVSANRYGFTGSQTSTNLVWSKTPGAGTDGNWISYGQHGVRRQNEAYYIKANEVGMGTVKVALKNGTSDVYYDILNVTVIPKKDVIIEKDGIEVTSPVDLSADSSAVLNATATGCTSPDITWESSDSAIVSLSEVSGNTVTVTREGFSNIPVIIKATVTDSDGISHSKSVYVSTASENTQPLRINSSKIVTDSATNQKTITVEQGETLTLSSNVSDALDGTATVWNATADGGRAPVKLNSTLGKYITITGRSATSTPIMITATNGGYSDTVYVNVAPSGEKSVRIIGAGLTADGFIVMNSNEQASLQLEYSGFDSQTAPTVTWSSTFLPNSEYTTQNTPGNVSIIGSDYNGAIIESGEPSLNFDKIKVSVNDGNTTYTDEIYVKVPTTDAVDTAKYLSIYQGDRVTLQSKIGPVTWYSNSQKTYFGDTSRKPTTVNNSVDATVSTLKKSGTTMNPSRISVKDSGGAAIDSVYVMVKAGSIYTVSFDLNGGYGITPDSIVYSTDDTNNSIVLEAPDAVYPSDDGEYEFFGWCEYADAGEPDRTRIIYLPGQIYTPSSQSKTLYAIWGKKNQDAMFIISLNGVYGAQYNTGTSSAEYSGTAVYVKNALSPASNYYNAGGVDSHLSAMPSTEDIQRIMDFSGLSFDPANDRVIWYEIKRISDNSAGLPNWHVDGVLVKDSQAVLTYDKNTSSGGVSNMPNPPATICDTGNTVDITTSVPTSSTMSFIGWNTKPDGSGDWYTATGSLYQNFEGTADTQIILTEDTTLYAIWAGTTICVNWEGSEPHPDEVTVNYKGTNYILSENNNWCMSSPSYSTNSSPVAGQVTGYRSTVSSNIMESSNGQKCVSYTITYIPCARYDINEDGVEDVDDIGFIIGVSAGLITNAADSQLGRADLNNDGTVDAFDAAWLDRWFCSPASPTELPQTSIEEITPVTVGTITPDKAIQITTNQTPSEIEGKDYADWDIDLVLTFNQAVNKDDIYIFGQYGTYDWAGGELAESGSLAANEDFSVIHTWLPSVLGTSSFALTYTDIVTSVRDFKCAIYANNPASGLEATVKLVATEPNGTVHVLDTYTCSFGSTAELPQTSIEEITPVTVNSITPNKAIQITTDQTFAEIDGKDYADWDIDLVLTFNQAVNKNDIYIFGQYGTYDWAGGKLDDNGSLAANEDFSVIHTWLPSVLGTSSFALTYTDIVTSVRDFKCAIYAENPASGLEATVKLVATEPGGTVHVLDTYTCSF